MRETLACIRPLTWMLLVWHGAAQAEPFGTPLAMKTFDGRGRLTLQALRFEEHKGSISRGFVGDRMMFRDLAFTISAPDWETIGSQRHGRTIEPRTARAPDHPPGLRLTGVMGGLRGAIRYDETVRLSPEGLLSIECSLTAVQPARAIVGLGPCFGFLAPGGPYRGRSLRFDDTVVTIPSEQELKPIVLNKEIPRRLTIESPDGLGAITVMADSATKYVQVNRGEGGILHFNWYLSGGEALLKPGGTVRYRFQIDCRQLLQARLTGIAPGADGKTLFREDFTKPDCLRLAMPNAVAFCRQYGSITSMATRKGGKLATATWRFALDRPRDVWLRAKSNNYGADWCRFQVRRGSDTEWSPVGEWSGKHWSFVMKPTHLLTPAHGDRFELRVEVSGNLDNGVSGGLDWFEVYTK